MRHDRGMLSAGTEARSAGLGWRPVAAVVCLLLLSQAGCFFRKHKVAEPQVRTPARIVLLPMNVPPGDTELRWVALAAPVLMAQAIGNSPDLEIVPMWESMPIARETLGDSRTLTVENAAYIASRLTARWATQGEITSDKAGISILLDFIPAKATLVPFRYEKKGPAASLGNYLNEAFEQFQRYLVARPAQQKKGVDPNSIRAIAEAIDREYGWFVNPEPGKSEAVVAGFAKTDRPIAGLLFNPNLYPGIESRPATPAPAPAKQPSAPAATPPPAPAPPASATPEQVSTVGPEAPQPVNVEPPPPAAPAPASPDEVDVPAPKPFIERINSPPVSNPPSPAPAESTPRDRPAPVELEPALRPAKAPTKPPPPSPLTSSQIQVFSSRSKTQAEAVLARLSGAGLRPELQKADLKEKGVWYRIRLNGYPSRQAAAAAGNKLRAEALIEDYWVVR